MSFHIALSLDNNYRNPTDLMISEPEIEGLLERAHALGGYL